MKALTYHGPKDVRVETVPDPTILADDDLILRVTATAICGSDLHLFRGKIPEIKDGDILGHEFMGIVEDVGSGVNKIRKGDRVVIPFVIACGECFYCHLTQFAACETTNRGSQGALVTRLGQSAPAALFGFSHLYGGVPGGQAEFVRVPKANVGPLVVPGSLADEQVLFLSDILPTGYQAVQNAEVKEGSTVAIYGAGPIGLMAAACAHMLGAKRIFMIDHHDYRLSFAEATYGVETINFDAVDDPAQTIVNLTGGRGVDAAIDAVGFEAKAGLLETLATAVKIESSSASVLRQCIAVTRRGGIVSIPGVYAGYVHSFLIGDAFDKGLSIRMGQTHVQRLLPELLEHIENGDLRPEAIITHRMALADAARGYQLFNDKTEGCRKVVLVPGMPAGSAAPDSDSRGRSVAGSTYVASSIPPTHSSKGILLDAVALLKKDHTALGAMLEELASTTNRAQKKRTELLDRIVTELKAHMTIEEEIFYPAFKDAGNKSDDSKMYYEALEEHRAAGDLVLVDLKGTDPSSEKFSGRAKVLKELIEHHVKDEEMEMFPRAKELLSKEQLIALGQQMAIRKEQLLTAMPDPAPRSVRSSRSLTDRAAAMS